MAIKSTSSREPLPDAEPEITAQYLLLVRHGARDFETGTQRHLAPLANMDMPTDPKDEGRPGVGEDRKRGLTQTKRMARWVAETIRVDPTSSERQRLRVTRIVTSGHEHCVQTAEAYLDAFNVEKVAVDDIEICALKAIETPAFWRPDEYLRANDLDDSALPVIRGADDRSVVVMCGHQPHLSWVYNELRTHYLRRGWRRFLPGKPTTPLPIGQSEAALIQLAPRVQVEWAVGDNPEKTETAFRKKIQSKMDAIKFIAGFVTLFIGFTLKWEPLGKDAVLTDPQLLLKRISLGLLVLTLGLLAAAFLALDRLTMPSVFWGGSQPKKLEPPPHSVGRPPSPVYWLLGIHMIRIWKRIVIPSLAFLGVAITGFVVLACGFRSLILVFACEAAALVLPWLAYVWIAPKLGYDD